MVVAVGVALMIIDGGRWLPYSVSGPGNHFYNGECHVSSETKIIDANNVDVLYTVVGDDDDDTIENVNGFG